MKWGVMILEEIMYTCGRIDVTGKKASRRLWRGEKEMIMIGCSKELKNDK